LGEGYVLVSVMTGLDKHWLFIFLYISATWQCLHRCEIHEWLLSRYDKQA